MPPRDELLLILDLSPSLLRAGVGVHDLIRGPLVEMPTRLARRPTSVHPFKLTDYLVGRTLTDAEAAGEELEIVHPMVVGKSGMEVTDWVGMEALFRFTIHTALLLPRPPLAHPVCLSLPPHLSPILVDQFHALLFEKLLVPQLLVASRPFFAAAGSGVTAGVVLDIGYRGEGSEVSVVVENQVVEEATTRVRGIDEGVCDDWLAWVLWKEDAGLRSKLTAAGAVEGVGETMREIVRSLKVGDHIGFESSLLNLKDSKAGGVLTTDENGEFDVAQALVEGKVDKIVSGKGGKGGESEQEEGDFVTVPNPLDPNGDGLKVGPSRHRYLEPLFMPQILEDLGRGEEAELLGLKSAYEWKEKEWNGIQEYVGLVVGQVEDAEVRRTVWENVVIVSSGKIAGIKALGPALIPLLSPFVIDPESGSETQPRAIRHAKVPDYFSEFKHKGGEWGCYLGGCILAKILISDLQSKLFMSKAEYTAKGPATYRLLDPIQS
ncbi:hypothetical protein T439DRAFT_322245 [Meredithblackwellia eburnea MCA 4105]